MRSIITGAAGGIGRATAEAFAADKGGKQHIMLVDLDEARLESVAQALAGSGATIIARAADLSDPEVPAALVDEASAAFGGLDTLVSNAGVASAGALNDISLEVFDRTIAVNLRATWLLAKAAHPWLKQSQGSLIATASVAGMLPTAFLGPYPASKAALIMMINQMAFEWGKDCIRCNCVSPGPISTDMNKTVFKDRENPDDRAARLALGRNGTPDEIAAVIQFLASPAASYITGTNIAADGGMRSSVMPALRGWDSRQ